MKTQLSRRLSMAGIDECKTPEVPKTIRGSPSPVGGGSATGSSVSGAAWHRDHPSRTPSSMGSPAGDGAVGIATGEVSPTDAVLVDSSRVSPSAAHEYTSALRSGSGLVQRSPTGAAGGSWSTKAGPVKGAHS